MTTTADTTGCLTLTTAGHAVAEGVVTIELPGLTAIRIDTARRFIAIDGISGTPRGPMGPEYLVQDLRDGTYGGFHRLAPADECFDQAGCAHMPGCTDGECGGCGEHVQGAYPHRHEDIAALSGCAECIERAADLRVLSGD